MSIVETKQKNGFSVKFFSMFTGVGGFELGLKPHGFKCVGVSEIDKYSNELLKKKFPEVKNYGNAETIDTNRLPDFNVLCGGFPCQAFSLAGKRKGFNDTRGTLFFEVARIIRAKKPKIVFLENVKGLLSHEGGRTFGRIIEVLGDLGYWVEWQVLNSKNFGVPQNRERVFIIGHLRGEGGGQGAKTGLYAIQSHSPRSGDPKGGGTGPLRSTEHSFTLDSSPHYVLPVGVAYRTRNYRGEEGQFEFRNDGVANQLTTVNKDSMVAKDTRIRRLTPRECERLQGFPDDWTKYGSSEVFYNVRLKGNIWHEINVQSRDAMSKQSLENQCFVLNITSDGKSGEILTQHILKKEEMNVSVQFQGVIEKLTAEECACDIINHGKDMVMLYNRKGTSITEEITQKSLIKENLGVLNTCLLWKISLEGNLEKKKLSTILTLIKKTILKKTFTCAKTGKPITNAIITWNNLVQNCSNKDVLDLRMANTTIFSDTQRYKMMGNAVTVNVIDFLGERLKEKCFK